MDAKFDGVQPRTFPDLRPVSGFARPKPAYISDMTSEHPDPSVQKLEELRWSEVAERFRRDPRLLVPVGSCIQHGPALPLGTDSVITAGLAEGIGRRAGILIAPLVGYGVASRSDLEYAGTAGLERRTLHRVLNELVESWGRQGLRELTLLTTNGHPRHIQALAMVIADHVRVRAIDSRAIDVSGVEGVDGGGPDIVEASLMMHLAPRLVVEGAVPGATAEKGRALYAYLVESIVQRLAASDG